MIKFLLKKKQKIIKDYLNGHISPENLDKIMKEINTKIRKLNDKNEY